MDARTTNIKQLISDSTYPIDETAIADAIIVRLRARRLVCDLAFRLRSPQPDIRSFRPHRGAPSFRMARARRRGSSGAMNAATHAGGVEPR